MFPLFDLRDLLFPCQPIFDRTYKPNLAFFSLIFMRFYSCCILIFGYFQIKFGDFLIDISEQLWKPRWPIQDGGWAESARADFKFIVIKEHSNNHSQTLWIFLNIIWEHFPVSIFLITWLDVSMATKFWQPILAKFGIFNLIFSSWDFCCLQRVYSHLFLQFWHPYIVFDFFKSNLLIFWHFWTI